MRLKSGRKHSTYRASLDESRIGEIYSGETLEEINRL